MESVTHLRYEYAQVAVDLFYEKSVVHCAVAVCIHIVSFLLYLKECVVILEFGSTVLCSWAR